MVDQNETITQHLDELLTSEPAFNSISKQRQFSALRANDELIISLANSYENRRAVQVNEWEQMQRRSVRQAA